MCKVLDLQKSQDSTIPEITLESLLDEKFAVHERIQKEGTQAIANAQKLSILDDGDAGYLGFN